MYYFDSYWSDYGCTKTEDSESYTVCECNHTTNFAILMQVTDLQVYYIYKPTGILHLQTYRYLTFTAIQLYCILSLVFYHGYMETNHHTQTISVNEVQQQIPTCHYCNFLVFKYTMDILNV